MTFKIAVTGSTASGKTVISNFLSEYLECKNYSADIIVSEIYRDKDFCLAKIKQKTPEILSEFYIVDKIKLKNWIIKDPNNLKQISQIVWKEFKKRILNIIDKENLKFIVIEVPLLFESESDKIFDMIVNVESDLEIQKQRAEKLSNIEKRLFQIFIDNQVTNEFRKNNSHITIINNKDLDDLKKEVLKIANKIKISKDANS